LGICFLGWYNKLLQSSLPWVLPVLQSYMPPVVRFSALHISKGSNGISGLHMRSAGPGLHSPEVFWPVMVSHIHLPGGLSFAVTSCPFFGVTHHQRFERNFWITHEVCWPRTAFTRGLLACDGVSHPPSWRTLIRRHQLSVFRRYTSSKV
jgi:hypothetical protein